MTSPFEPPRAGYVFDNAARCRGCGAGILWWITPAGKKSPHDHDGVSHFATCPERERFRTKVPGKP